MSGLDHVRTILDHVLTIIGTESSSRTGAARTGGARTGGARTRGAHTAEPAWLSWPQANECANYSGTFVRIPNVWIVIRMTIDPSLQRHHSPVRWQAAFWRADGLSTHATHATS